MIEGKIDGWSTQTVLTFAGTDQSPVVVGSSQRFPSIVTEQEVIDAVLSCRDEITRGCEIAFGVGGQSREFRWFFVPLSQVVDGVPRRQRRLGVSRTKFFQLTPQTSHVNALRIGRGNPDVEFQDTGSAKQSLQVFRIIKAGALRLVLVVRRLNLGQRRFKIGVLGLQRSERFVTLTRTEDGVARLVSASTAFFITLQNGLVGQGQDATNPLARQSKFHQGGQRVVEADFSVGHCGRREIAIG